MDCSISQYNHYLKVVEFVDQLLLVASEVKGVDYMLLEYCLLN